jgi:hypothetical protein
MSMSITYPLTRIEPTPVCDGAGREPHVLEEMWPLGFLDENKSSVGYLCRTCQRRIRITASLEEVRAVEEGPTEAKGAGHAAAHKPAAQGHAHAMRKH